MKEYHVCGLGNAIVDIFVELTDNEFAPLDFERGTMRLVDTPTQKALLDRFHDREPRLVSGGSVANSIIAFSQLGGNGAFIGAVGDDRYGLFYKGEFDELDIDIGNPVIVGESTGTCVCLITPDAERTMRTNLGVSANLSARHVDPHRISRSEWLFVEGYLFANPETSQTAVREAIHVAKKNGVKVAVTCSDGFIVTGFVEPFTEALRQTDLLFANSAEACALTGASTAEAAFAKLKDLVPAAVVTHGPDGAYVRYGGVESHVPAFACEPKDLTGAGDMLAGSFLHGITHGVPPARAVRAGCFLAMKVITQIGARLHHGSRAYWQEALGME